MACTNGDECGETPPVHEQLRSGSNNTSEWCCLFATCVQKERPDFQQKSGTEKLTRNYLCTATVGR